MVHSVGMNSGIPRQRIAVIGSGIAGLGALYLLSPHHDVTLFEGMETTREVLVDPRSIRQAYLREMQEFVRRSESLCKEGEITYRLVRTGDAADQVLLSLLSGRAAGRGGRARGGR